MAQWDLAEYEPVEDDEITVYRNPVTGVHEEYNLQDWSRRTGSDEIEKFYTGGVKEKPTVVFVFKGTETDHGDPTLPGRVKKAITRGTR